MVEVFDQWPILRVGPLMGVGQEKKIKESVHFLQHPIVISFTQHETLLKKENVCIKVFFLYIY